MSDQKDVPSEKINLADVYHEINILEANNPPEARKRITNIVAHIDDYTAIRADYWFNLAASAGRLNLMNARTKIIDYALTQFPDNVDLLCDKFQTAYSGGSEAAGAEAAELWETLSALPQAKFYWRYWVYGANYHARVKRDRQAALQILDQGLLNVPSDELMDIVRNYRAVLIDEVPPIPPHDLDTKDRRAIMEYRQSLEKEAFQQLEKIYKFGIELGVEGGYHLALQLAVLYMEHAASTPANTRQDDQDDYYKKALYYLDLAEKMFTGMQGINHPIWEVYLIRARVYMGQHKYTDALKLFRSVPESRREDGNFNVDAQMKYAAAMIGEVLDEPRTTPTSALPNEPPTLDYESPETLLRALAEQGAQGLYDLAQKVEPIREMVRKVAQALEA